MRAIFIDILHLAQFLEFFSPKCTAIYGFKIHYRVVMFTGMPVPGTRPGMPEILLARARPRTLF